MKTQPYIALFSLLLILPVLSQAASPTAEAFSQQVMLGVKVSNLKMPDLADAERECVSALSDTMLGDAFDTIFDSILSRRDRDISDAHYDSVLAKKYFEWFSERARVSIGGDASAKSQVLSNYPVEEVGYMNAFATSTVGKKVNSVLRNQAAMVPVKNVVMTELHRCNRLGRVSEQAAADAASQGIDTPERQK